MPTLAKLQVPAHDAIFGTTFERVPMMKCVIDPALADSLPEAWIQGAPQPETEAAFDVDPMVETYSQVLQENNRWLYDISFTGELCTVLSLVFDEDGSVLELAAAHGLWTLWGRFPARANIGRTYERLHEEGFSTEIAAMRPYDDPTNELGLTPEQRETLETAIEYGYFEIPREITMTGLADKLDISHQAVSERLRRAYKTLVTAELNLETGAAASRMRPLSTDSGIPN